MLKKTIWFSILIIASAGLVFLTGGFYRALSISNNSTADADRGKAPADTSRNNAAVPQKAPGTIEFVIIGDSIAKGTGDEKAKGFTADIPEIYKNITPRDVKTDNLGIDGLQSAGLLEELQSGKLNPLLQKSDYILLSIGGNDIRSLETLKDTIKEDELNKRMEVYLGNLKDCMKEIRKQNKKTMIVFLGLYNPFYKNNSLEDIRLINTWNYNSEQLIEEDGRAIFVPTVDLFKFNGAKYIASDGIHPDSAGYEAISDRLVKTLAGVE